MGMSSMDGHVESRNIIHELPPSVTTSVSLSSSSSSSLSCNSSSTSSPSFNASIVPLSDLHMKPSMPDQFSDERLRSSGIMDDGYGIEWKEIEKPFDRIATTANGVDHHVVKWSDFGFCIVWREFCWGAIAGAFGEGMMHPIDTIKTRIQSQAILTGTQNQKSIPQMTRAIWAADGLRGFYRGITPGVTGSLATGATYFGVIESTKKWIEESHPNLGGHWAHFFAGAVGDTLGSFVYVPCEVMKQRMQVQGTRKSWISVVMKDNFGRKPGVPMYGYYTGIFHAGCSIWKEQGLKGLYAGYWSTLARDVPFAGLMVVFYEALKDVMGYGKQRWNMNPNGFINSSMEGLMLGGLAGGFSAYLTTPLDVIKTRLQVQGSSLRYNGWLDAVCRIWTTEGVKGMFRGSIPRITWYVPASALTFMAVEFLRDHFNERLNNEKVKEVALLSVDKKGSSLQEVV